MTELERGLDYQSIQVVKLTLSFCHAGTGVTNVMGVCAILGMVCLLSHCRLHTTEGGNRLGQLADKACHLIFLGQPMLDFIFTVSAQQ